MLALLRLRGNAVSSTLRSAAPLPSSALGKNSGGGGDGDQGVGTVSRPQVLPLRDSKFH